MNKNKKMYDSYWLSKYLVAKQFIATHYPEKLEEFVTRLDVFRTDPNFIVKELPEILSQDVLDFIKKIIQNMPQSKLQLHEIENFGRHVLHNSPIFNKVHATLTDRVSDLVG